MALPGDLYPDFDPNGVGLQNGHFIGLPFQEAEAQLVLLSIPWDATVSFGDGTATGSDNILAESPQLDLYDPLLPDAWKYGLYLRPADPAWREKNRAIRAQAQQYIEFLEAGGKLAEAPEMQAILDEVNAACFELKEWVAAETRQLLDQGKLVGLVGGDHSTPLGFLEVLAERHGSFGILQIDAHMDLRKAYEGFTYSHASIFYNALQIPQVSRLVQAGIRDLCQEEMDLATQAGERVQVFTDAAIRRQLFQPGGSYQQVVETILAALPDKVYISFDIDGLDPSLCPNTGTPVPGGFGFQELSAVGADGFPKEVL